MASKKEIVSAIKRLMRENDINPDELRETKLEGNIPSVEKGGVSTEIEPRKRGISDVGVSQKNPSLTNGPIVGSRAVIGRRGMKEISDRIFNRRRRR